MEIIVVLLLVTMIFSVTLLIYQTSLASYKATAERVDAQSQFRLITGILEKEVGTATYATLINLTDIEGTLPSEYEDMTFIYSKMDDDGKYGKFYKKIGNAEEKAFVTPYPLQGLTMKFQQDVSENVLRVFLHAKDINEYEGSIYLQNGDLVLAQLGVPYDVIAYISLN